MLSRTIRTSSPQLLHSLLERGPFCFFITYYSTCRRHKNIQHIVTCIDTKNRSNPSNFNLDIYVALLIKTFEIHVSFIVRTRGVKKGEPEDKTHVCFRVEPLLKQITQVPVSWSLPFLGPKELSVMKELRVVHIHWKEVSSIIRKLFYNRALAYMQIFSYIGYFFCNICPSKEVVKECSNVLCALRKTQVVSIHPRLRQ